MAIADLNNDKYNDIVTIDENGSKFSVHYFEQTTLTYTNTVSIDMPEGYLVDSVVVLKAPKEFQSLMVVASQESSQTQSSYKTIMLVYDQIQSSDGTITYKWKQSDSDLTNLEIM